MRLFVVVSSSTPSKAGILAPLGKIQRRTSGHLISSLMQLLRFGNLSFHGFDAWSQADLAYKSLNQVNPEDDMNEEEQAVQEEALEEKS